MNKLLVRVIYYDLSEWFGSPNTFNSSPHKGILYISVTYLGTPYRHLMSGKDYYYVKDQEIGMFNGEEKKVRIVKLLGPGKEKVEIKNVKDLDLDFLRMGVWVEDRIMRIASKRILERVEEWV